MKPITPLQVLLFVAFLCIGLQSTSIAQNSDGSRFTDQDASWYAHKQTLMHPVALAQSNDHFTVVTSETDLLGDPLNNPGQHESSRSVQSCYFAPDGTYSNFPGNDDGSIGPITLGFNFNLYGSEYTEVYINNNGNLTFTGAVSEYTASGFPIETPMVAPFWSDEDTRCGNTAKYKINPTNMIVTWPGVGYYNNHCNLVNTFQVIISNGLDPLIGIGNNVCFHYGDMQWTTGDASGGSGGFGGTPATVGINKGSDNLFVQIGRFGVNSSAYDGPGGATDGINYLDNQCFCFNVSNADNIPPSSAGFPAGNVLDMCVGTTQNLTLSFSPPEVTQTVTVSVNAGGLCGVTFSQNGNGSTVATVNMSIMGLACNAGSHTITFTATDNFVPAGVTTVSLVVNVNQPTIVCPANMSVPNDDGLCGANVNFAATATGTPPITISYSQAPGSFFPRGTTLVTATATDACGSTSCTFQVTVNDTEEPTITCPADVTHNSDFGQCSANLTIPQPVASDNCSSVIVPELVANGNFNSGSTSWNACSNIVEAGNFETVYGGTNNSNRVAEVDHDFNPSTSDDRTLCQNINGFTIGKAYVLTFKASRRTAGSPPTVGTIVAVNGGALNTTVLRSNTIWSLTQETFTFIATQTTHQLTFVPSSGWSGSLGILIDDISIKALPLTITNDHNNTGNASGNYPVGTTIVTWTATDLAGNSTTCTQSITIEDHQPPSITCPADVNEYCTGSTDPFYMGYAAATDNCDVEGITYSDVITAGNCAGNYTITRTWVATDIHGNSTSCDQVISVYDTEGPSTQDVCPSAIDLGLPADVECSTDLPSGDEAELVFVTFVGFYYYADHCSDLGSVNISDPATSGDECNGTATYNIHVYDDCGNVNSECSFVITWSDNTAPSFTPPVDVTLYKDANCNVNDSPSGDAGDVTDEADNCSTGLNATYTDVIDNNCQNTYIITRIWSLMDHCGHRAIDQWQIITVQDTTAPTFTRPVDITIYTNANCVYDESVADGGDVVDEHDNCSTNLQATYTDVVTNGPCAGSYVITRTWHLMDHCNNNAADQVQTITIGDNTPPVLTCPSNITAQCNAVTYTATATDNCGGPVSITYSTPPGSSFPVGVSTVTVTATDACGNSSTCSFTVTTYVGNLTGYHLIFTNGSVDANWQGASKGYIGNVAVDGIQAAERTSGNVPYAGTVYTNAATLGPWQNIVNANAGQAYASYNQTSRLSGLESELEGAFTMINALPVTAGYDGVSSTSLNNLNTQNGNAQIIVINVTSGFQVSSKINITGDASDMFILRWDTDKIFSNGYNGQVKFQSGGAIVPLGGLTASNFTHVAGDINASGGGSNPPAPYPQGPRTNNGLGTLINGGSNFSGGGFFTGYWLTTGTPTITGSGQPYGTTSPLSNGIFVGGWYSKTTKFSMTSGTSGVYVGPCTGGNNFGDNNDDSRSVKVLHTEDTSGPLTVNAWPNPSDNQFTLKADSRSDEKIVVAVYNVLGKAVLQTDMSNGTPIRFGEELNEGVYFVQVRQGKNTSTIKLVKQHGFYSRQ